MEVAVAAPRAGVMSVGVLARTTAPVPVVLAADIAVPLPESMPVTLVVRVMAGVVVAVATVPAKPFAVTTETLVTVPEPDALSVNSLPVDWSPMAGMVRPGVVDDSKSIAVI